MENNQTIGAKLVALRKAKGVTQADLGAYLNISYQAVSKWERDESCPDFNTLSRIAQYFGVSITYFESGNKETAYTATASAPATREMLGVCKDCGKVVYAGGEGKTAPILMCKECVEKHAISEKEARKKKENKRKKEENKRVKGVKDVRNRGFIWGGIAAALVLVLFIIGAVDSEDAGEIIVTGLVFTALTFTFVSQLFWDGAVADCTFAGGEIIGTPGVIFTFDLDGFIFLIAIKLLFAVLKMLVWLVSVLICAIGGIIISPFTFVPALLRVNAETRTVERGKGNSSVRNCRVKMLSPGEDDIEVRFYIMDILKMWTPELSEEGYKLADIIIENQSFVPPYPVTRKKAEKIAGKFRKLGAEVEITQEN